MDYTNFYVQPGTGFWLKVNEVFQENKCLHKVSKRNILKRCEIFLKAARKTPKWRQWHRFDVFIVNFEHIPHLFIVFFQLNLNRSIFAESICSILVEGNLSAKERNLFIFIYKFIYIYKFIFIYLLSLAECLPVMKEICKRKTSTEAWKIFSLRSYLFTIYFSRSKKINRKEKNGSDFVKIYNTMLKILLVDNVNAMELLNITLA